MERARRPVRLLKLTMPFQDYVINAPVLPESWRGTRSRRQMVAERIEPFFNEKEMFLYWPTLPPTNETEIEQYSYVKFGSKLREPLRRDLTRLKEDAVITSFEVIDFP